MAAQKKWNYGLLAGIGASVALTVGGGVVLNNALSNRVSNVEDGQYTLEQRADDHEGRISELEIRFETFLNLVEAGVPFDEALQGTTNGLNATQTKQVEAMIDERFKQHETGPLHTGPAATSRPSTGGGTAASRPAPQTPQISDRDTFTLWDGERWVPGVSGARLRQLEVQYGRRPIVDEHGNAWFEDREQSTTIEQPAPEIDLGQNQNEEQAFEMPNHIRIIAPDGSHRHIIAHLGPDGSRLPDDERLNQAKDRIRADFPGRTIAFTGGSVHPFTGTHHGQDVNIVAVYEGRFIEQKQEATPTPAPQTIIYIIHKDGGPTHPWQPGTPIPPGFIPAPQPTPGVTPPPGFAPNPGATPPPGFPGATPGPLPTFPPAQGGGSTPAPQPSPGSGGGAQAPGEVVSPPLPTGQPESQWPSQPGQTDQSQAQQGVADNPGTGIVNDDATGFPDGIFGGQTSGQGHSQEQTGSEFGGHEGIVLPETQYGADASRLREFNFGAGMLAARDRISEIEADQSEEAQRLRDAERAQFNA